MLKRLQELATNQDGFAFDPRSGESFRMNESATFIFQMLRQGASVEKAAMTFASHYSLSRIQAFEDVQDFILQLKLNGLI